MGAQATSKTYPNLKNFAAEIAQHKCFLRKKSFKNQMFLIEYWVKVYFGGIAQLGERSVRIREVEGSNPFESTKKIQQ